MKNEPRTNYTKIPNEVLEAMSDMSEVELKLTSALVRETYGRHADDVRMTYQDMATQAGIKSKSSISDAIERVEERGFFRRGRRSMWYVNSTKFVPNETNESTESVPNDSDKGTNSVPGDSTNSVPLQYNKEKEEKEINKGGRKTCPVPTVIARPEFMNAWGEWLAYHEERGKPLTFSTSKKQLQEFLGVPTDTAVAMIEQSITQGWTGLFELKPSSNGQSPNIGAGLADLIDENGDWING